MTKSNNADIKQHGKRKGIGGKIAKGCAIGVAASAVVLFGGLLAYVRVSNSDFYSQATAEFETPGLKTGFVPQDLAYVESANAWLFSGYDGSDGPSPIWRVNADGTSTYMTVLEPDGTIYHGHGGGMTVSDKFAYLTCENGYFVLPLSELLQDGDDIQAKAVDFVDVGFTPAFINMQDGVLYTGVFYYEGPYSTPEKMHLTSPDGTQNHAIMYAYAEDKSAKYGIAKYPFAVYSIPDKVQGVAVTLSNQFIFSTSWGVADSVLPRYALNDLQPDGTYNVGGQNIDLFFMDGRNYEGFIKAPPMMEGIVLHDGRIWLSNESACNKYFFGKFYDGGTIFSIPA